MAKISTYPVVSPEGSDIIIGTDGSNMNATKNFTAQSIADLSPPQDLQSVLDTGNTATQDINLTGGINVTGNLSVTGHFVDSSGDLGTSGQLLMATATGTNWSTPIVPNLQNVLDLGNTATQDINLTGKITTDILIVNNSLTNSGEYYDATSSVGTAGQILSSTGSATQWIDDVTPNLQNVLDAGHIAIQDINLTGQIQVTGDTFATNSTVVDLITTKDIYVQEKIYDSGFSGGTIGQLLSSTGTGTEWVSISGLNPTLQTVLDQGNTAIQDINLTGEINATGRIVSGTVVQGGEVLGTTLVDAPVQLSVGGYLMDSSGNVGIAGQVLSATATGVDWVSLPAPTAYPLQDVLNAGNSATSNMTITGTVSATSLIGGTVTASTTLTSSGNLYVNGRLHDAGNSPGTAGQVLASTGSAVDWITLPSTPTLQDVLDSGNNAVQDIVLNGGVDATTVSATDITSSGQLTSNGTANINGTLEDDLSSPGTSGQLLSSTATGVRWVDSASTYPVLGWNRIDDGEYDSVNKLELLNGVAVTVPNNGNVVVSYGTYSFYNSASKKILAENEDDTYTITVTFKAEAPNANSTHLDLTMISGSATPYDRLSDSLVFAKGNSVTQNFHVMYQYYADADFVTNGVQLQIEAHGGDAYIWDVIYFIQRNQIGV